MAIPNKEKLKEIQDELAKSPAATQEKPEVITSVSEKPNDNPVLSLDELPEEEFLKAVEKRGFKISKNELTDEQKKKAEEIEEVEKLKFAVEQNIVTPERYQELKAILNSDGADLTKKEFAATYKKQNKDATKEDIDSAYADYYTLDQKIKVKEIKKTKDEFDNEVDEEVEVEKPKYDDRLVNWGKQRIETKAERIKEGAKQVLDNIDTNYSNFKAFKVKAEDYSKSVEKVVSSTDFSKYPVNFKIKGKEVSATVDLPKDAQEEVRKYLFDNRFAGLVIANDKQKDESEIKSKTHDFLKSRYEEKFNESFWDLAKSEGINEAKVGSNAPLTKETISLDRPDELEKEARDRVPNIPGKFPKNTNSKK